MSEQIQISNRMYAHVYGPDKRTYVFFCPGCDHLHSYFVGSAWGDRHNWHFNGDAEKPSFTPSLLNTRPDHRCHLFLTEGKLHYCGDCTHSLAGKVVDLPVLEMD